jgi:hypothetical protein
VKFLRFAGLLLLTATFSGVAARSSFAQSSFTNADIQRLQDAIYDASRDVSQLRGRDSSLASQLQSELDDLRDETIYFKVKLRHNETISSSAFNDVRDRVEDIRSRARGDANGRYSQSSGARDTRDRDSGYRDQDSSARQQRPLPPSPSANPNEVPVGAEFDVRLQSSLSSATAQVEDRFDATTLVDLRDDRGKVLVPAGSTMRGIISSVDKATRTQRTGRLTVAFDRVTINGRSYPMRATVTQALESEGIKGEKEKIGIGAGAGAILGAILGGAKGALAGILIGGGGTIAATEGKDVDLPAGTTLRVRLDSPLQLR